MSAKKITLAIETKRTSCEESFDWCLRRAEANILNREYEQAANWCQIAGKLTETFVYKYFSNERLEKALNTIAENISPARIYEKNAVEKKRWLHVLTQAYQTGGHTALCRRWIEIDSSGDEHSLILTSQCEADSDPKLLEAVRIGGGNVIFLDTTENLTHRALTLKDHSATYDVIVLHIHMWDPIAAIAFGTAGGPPVLIVNHADHLYWMGVSVADLILNIRPSGEQLCELHRGCDRLGKLSIPLPIPPLLSQDDEGMREKRSVREDLDIPSHAIIFLTIGSSYKFTPMAELSFFEASRKLLLAVPNSYLIAIGPSLKDDQWAVLKTETEGRVLAIGRRQDLSRYFEAADIYLEGFPFGSLTALLEAALAGLPIVLAPAECPLPFRSDDFALTMAAPMNMDAYVAAAVKLAEDAEYRDTTARSLRQATVEWHCGAGWNAKLRVLRASVTHGLEHRIWPVSKILALPEAPLRYWTIFSENRTKADDPFRFVLRQAIFAGLAPRPDFYLFLAMKNASTILRASLIMSAAFLLTALPPKFRRRLFSSM